MILALLLLASIANAQIKRFSGSANELSVAVATGGYLFAGSVYGGINQWNITSGNLIRTIQAHNQFIKCMQVSIDGTSLFSGSADNSIKQWNVSTGELIKTFVGNIAAVNAIAVSGEFLFSGSVSRQFIQWQISSGAQLQQIFVDAEVKSLQAYRGDNSILIGLATTYYCRFLVSENRFDNSWTSQIGFASFNSMSVTDDNAFLLVAKGSLFSLNFYLEKYQVPSGQLIASFLLPANNVAIYTIAISGDYLYAGMSNNMISTFKLSSSQWLSFNYQGHTAAINSIFIFNNNLFSAADDKSVIQWCLMESYQTAYMTCLACPANSLCTSPSAFTCSPGYFRSNSVCLACPANSQCTSLTAFTCNNGYWRSEFNCAVCPLNAVCSGNQLSCNSGYYLTNTNQCGSCPANSTCSSPTLFTCLPNHYNRTGYDCAPCPINSASCAGGDFTCATGYFKSGDLCVGCPANSRCTSMSDFDCNPGYFQSDSKCAVCPVNGYCSNNQIMCSYGYYLDGSVCQSCPANSGCTLPTNFTCNTNYYKSGTGCLRCPSKSVCNETGFTCDDGHYEMNGECFYGSPQETTPTANPNMKSSTTLKVIPNPTDDPTGKCDDGYYLSANSKECTVCPENAVCSNSKMNCIDGYENINEKCEKQSAQSASLNVGLISGAAAGGVLLAVIVVAGFLSIGRSRRLHRANSANPLTVASKYQTSNTAIFTPPSRFDPGDNSGEAVYSSVESLGQQFIPETHASNDFSGVRTINNRSLPLLPPGY